MPGYIKKCPECGGIGLILNKEKGEVICRDCGLVIEEKMIDFGQEWREFDSDQGDKRRRTGAPLSYSVDYSEPIVIKEDNKVKVVKIGKFVDDILAEKNSFIKKQGNIEFVPVNDVECVAFDKDYNIDFRKVTEISRHSVDEMYEINLETGKKVCVTGNHSVFSVKDNKVVSVKVSELKEKEFLVAPLRIPNGINVKNLNLIDEFINFGVKYPKIYLRNFNDENGFVKIKEIEKNNPILKGKVKHWIRHKTLPFWFLNRFSREFNIYDYDLNGCKIGIYSSVNELPLNLDIDKKLCRLLGYFISEGTAGKYNVVFSFGKPGDSEYIEDVKSIMGELFGFKVGEFEKETNAVQLSIPSKLLSILLKDILKTGCNAKSKRVPNLVYSLANEMKLEFLQSYINGDGSKLVIENVNARPTVCVSTSSVSEALTNDIITLYSQLGLHANYQEVLIPGHIIKKTGQLLPDSLATRSLLTNPDSAYNLGYLDEAPLKNRGKPCIETFVPAPDEYKKEWKSRKRFRVGKKLALKIADKYRDNELRKLASSEFLFLRVRNIKKVKPTSEYAYDLTVPGYENFVGGRGGIFLHNTKYDRGLGTDVGQKGDIFKLTGKGRNKFFRLRKWQYRISTAIERNLKLALAELKRVASYLKLPKSVEEESARIYTMAVQRGLVRGRSMESVVAGALYAACRRHEIPRTLDELSEASGIDKKEIGRTYRFITRELQIRILPSNPVDYIPRFASALKLTAETQSKAVEILENAEKAELTSGRGPTGIAAASLYVAALLNNERRTQREVADIAGVTEVTIRNRYKELLVKLKLKEKVKKVKK